MIHKEYVDLLMEYMSYAKEKFWSSRRSKLWMDITKWEMTLTVSEICENTRHAFKEFENTRDNIASWEPDPRRK